MKSRTILILCLLISIVFCLAACKTTISDLNLSTEPLVDKTESFEYLSESKAIERTCAIDKSYTEEENIQFMIVNGETVSKAKYLRLKERKIFTYENSLAQIMSQDFGDENTKSEAIEALEVPTEESVISGLVKSVVRDQEISKRNIQISDEEAYEYAKTNYENNLSVDPDGFAKTYEIFVQYSGLSFNEYMTQNGRIMLKQMKLTEQLSSEGITDIAAYISELAENADVKILD